MISDRVEGHSTACAHARSRALRRSSVPGTTRGFFGRSRAARDPRLPPGQYDARDDWPVLHAEATPRLDTDRWTFTVEGLVERARQLDVGADPRPAAVALRGRHPLRDHLVQARHDLRRRLGRHPARRGPARWPSATHVVAFSHTGYTTNLPLADVTGGKAWVVWDADGQAAHRRARRPGPAAGAAPVLLEERQVGRRAAPARPRRAGVLGAQRLPRPRRSLAGAAVPGRLSPMTFDTASPHRRAASRARARRPDPLADRAGARRPRRDAPRARPSGWRCRTATRHLAGQYFVLRLTRPTATRRRGRTRWRRRPRGPTART